MINRPFITAKAMEAIRLNETGGHDEYIYRFSDPDGERTGKSGWSFGRVQFDTRNNWKAIECLRACGFTVEEAVSVIEQSAPADEISRLNAKLLSNHHVVDRFDTAEINQAVEWCMRLVEGYGIKLSPEAVMMVHIVDYHNQLYMSMGGKLHRWLQAQTVKGPVTADAFLEFKLTQTAWGRKRSDDVKRRWRNIQKLMGG